MRLRTRGKKTAYQQGLEKLKRWFNALARILITHSMLIQEGNKVNHRNQNKRTRTMMMMTRKMKMKMKMSSNHSKEQNHPLTENLMLLTRKNLKNSRTMTIL